MLEEKLGVIGSMREAPRPIHQIVFALFRFASFCSVCLNGNGRAEREGTDGTETGGRADGTGTERERAGGTITTHAAGGRVSPKCPRNISETYPKRPRNIPETFPKYLRYIPETSRNEHKKLSKKCPNAPKNDPKWHPKSSKMSSWASLGPPRTP